MFENNIEWIFPEKIEEVYDLIKEEENLIHAGGLSLNRLRPSKTKRFIDIQRTGLDFLSVNGDTIHIGPFLSVAEFIERSKSIKTDGNTTEVLSDVFSNAGSTSIRNRMTIGGSIAASPAWSDIIPVLIALDAKLELYNGKKDSIEIMDFLSNRPDSPFILTDIIIKNGNYKWLYRRLTNVRFDYPYMNFCAVSQNGRNVCVLTQSDKRYRRFELSEYEKNNIEFRDDIYYSADYKKHLLDVYIKETREEFDV